MLFYTGLLFLVIAVSLDGFGVGVTYGVRKVHVPFIALVIIMLCSGIIVLTSMTVGNMLSSFISVNIAKMLGGFILILLGLFVLFTTIRSKLNRQIAEHATNETTNKMQDFRTVLTTPDRADLDKSGTISASEAILLGTALAMDAFGAGIGASMLGYSPLLTAILIAFMSGLFVFTGVKIGLLLSESKQLQYMTFLPPLLLIALGLFNIY